MASVTPNPAAGGFSGAFGDVVFVRRKNGKIFIRRRPIRKTEKKAGEIANQNGFVKAVAYAKAVWSSQPELKKRYDAAAREQGRQGFNLAKVDFRLPPKIGEVDLSAYRGSPGDVIRVIATDDFEVKEVLLVLRRLNGDLIEQGAAVADHGAWAYQARTQVPAGATITVEAVAVDYPGHTVSKRLDHACRVG